MEVDKIKRRILIVDDETGVRESLRMVLKDAYDSVAVASGADALEALATGPFDVVLLDIVMPGMDGLELLEEVRSRNPRVPVIMLTATKTVKTAVGAMKLGAFDYVTKPFDVDELRVILDKATENAALVREVEELRHEVGRRYQVENIIGRSPKMQEVFRTVLTVAPLKTTILIRRSGTGNIAKAITREPPRAQPSSANCAATRDPARERALRAREGLVHRRPPEEARPVRARPRRQPLPRRDRRDGSGDAGEAAPRPRARRVPARRRPARGQRRRPHHRRDEPRPHGGDQGPELPRRSLLPAERRSVTAPLRERRGDLVL
jgi:CheY-like chemotaxis protein